MSESVCTILYYGGLALTILFVVVAVILFFVLKIPRAIGDLTGFTAKKSIKEMNQDGGSKTTGKASKKEQAKYYNQGSEKIRARETVSEESRRATRDNTTDALRRTGTLSGKPSEEETEILSNKSKAHASEMADETEVLSGSGSATKDLHFTDNSIGKPRDEEATDILVSETEGDETEVLTAETESDETEVLTAETEGDETEILTAETEGDETEILTAETDEDATDVLTSDMEDTDATSVLSSDNSNVNATRVDMLSRKVKVIYNIIEVHTDETL